MVKKSAKQTRYVLDISEPVDAEVVVPEKFAEYLRARIKVNGKLNNLAAAGVVVTAGEKEVVVTATGPLSKRYLKYLSRRYLSVEKLREYYYLLATAKDTYTFRMNNADDEEEQEEEEEPEE